MMRFAVLFLYAFALPGLAGGGSAWAQRTQDPPAAGGGPEEVKPPKLSELPLDELFEKLAASSPNPAGKAVENEILNRFAKSGSDTTDLLMRWAMEAIEEKNYAMALDILDQVLVLKPDFAEAWNKRATVYFLMDEYSASLSDIRQTLALEPRHFGALAGLGMIFQAMDRKADAIRVFERALAVNPQLDNVREALEQLKKDTAGDSI